MAGARVKTKAAASGADGDLTAAQLDKRLNLQRRGREDGSKNLPVPEAVALSEAEAAILETLQAFRERIDTRRHDLKADTEARLRAMAPPDPELAAPAAEARLLVRQTGGRL